MSEILDLVDVDDVVIWSAPREQIYKEWLHNFRCVNIFLCNSSWDILIPIRDMNRSIYPWCYDFSCGEHVMSGETYVQTAVRWLQEELWIHIHSDALYELGKWKPQDWFWCYAMYYLLSRNREIYPNALEWISAIRRVTIDEFIHMTQHEADICKWDLIMFHNYFLTSLVSWITKLSSD